MENMLSVILEFPMPKDKTGVRSWFELVVWGFSKTSLMEPLRALLTPKTDFSWSQELEESFGCAKEEIVKLASSTQLNSTKFN